MIKRTSLFLSLILILSCSGQNKVSSNTKVEQTNVSQEKSNTSKVLFISGTRQNVFPGIDDGSGRYTENFILKLDVPRDYNPEMSMELMGYVIPIDREITFISEKEKALLMFTITYPLMDNYDEADNPAFAIPILFFKTEGALIKLDISGCRIMSPVAYPSMNKEGGY